MPSLEPLLIKIMLTNIAAELTVMETTFKTLRVRIPKVEEAQTNCKTCQVLPASGRGLHTSTSSPDQVTVTIVTKEVTIALL